ncbi:serine/threonine protein phosphatase [Candidatus Bathyarchaeota archaeon]|nr:serine/threonine protein phosphatase [Candidatus Bathyarchaeota archaeon]
MNSHVETAPFLAKLATESSIDEFLRLIRQVNTKLAGEDGKVGSLKITGRLVEAPANGEVIIVGDLHGDLKSLVHILADSNFLGKMKNGNDVRLIFLGDYGDRGVPSPEVYYVVLKLKDLFPEHVILMRGNHEGPPDLLASPHDLPIQLKKKFGKKGSEAYLQLRDLFNHLYTGVIIEDRFVLFHGGAPSQAISIDDIAYAHNKHPRERHLEEILWNDPWKGIKGTIASPRGAGRLFGEDVTKKLLKMLNVKALIRSHQSCPEGYMRMHQGTVLTIFSRKGPPYNNTFGSYLHLDLTQKMEKPQQLLQWIHRF